MYYEKVKNHPEVLALLERGDHDLGVLGYTDHSAAHTALVAERAAYILRKLGYSDREEELARVSLGNVAVLDLDYENGQIWVLCEDCVQIVSTEDWSVKSYSFDSSYLKEKL